MSAAWNIKVMAKSQSDDGVSSALPLPRSMMPLPKAAPKVQHGGPSNPASLYQHPAKPRPSFSPSTVCPAQGPARGSPVKNNLLQQRPGLYSHRRSDGTCSAYSSPQVPKREAPRSKDTLDVRASTLSHKALRDLQLRRNANQNWTFGRCRLRSVDNAAGDNAQAGHGKEHLLYAKGANGNEIPGVSTARTANVQREVRNISNLDRQVSNPVEVPRNKPKSPHRSFNTQRRGSEPSKVNMAAVAPYRFRWWQCFPFLRTDNNKLHKFHSLSGHIKHNCDLFVVVFFLFYRFQVHEDTDASFDDLSDCSSDSMEVCCDDLGKSLKITSCWFFPPS